MKRFLVCVCAALLACSNSNDKNDSGTGSEGGSDVVAGGIMQTGVVNDRTLKTAEVGATVTVMGGASATTDMNGKYSVSIPKDTPYTFFVTGDNHFKLIEQELIATDSFDRGATSHPSNTDGNLLKGILMSSGFDPKLATFTVGLYPTGTCMSAEGALIDLDPPQPNAKVMYFAGGIPSTAMYAPYVQKDQYTPAAIFFNVDPKSAVKVKVTWAMADGGSVGMPCTQVPYPVQDPSIPNIKYTGNLVIDVGDVTSYERVYLK